VTPSREPNTDLANLLVRLNAGPLYELAVGEATCTAKHGQDRVGV
jgi:hypothetical protein